MKAPIVFLVPFLFGVIGLFNIETSSRYAMFRQVDIVSILAIGACLGVTVVGVILMIRGRRPSGG